MVSTAGCVKIDPRSYKEVHGAHRKFTMKQATVQESPEQQVSPMRYDAPNTHHPLAEGVDREQQRVADLGMVVSTLARKYLSGIEGTGDDDGQGE